MFIRKKSWLFALPGLMGFATAVAQGPIAATEEHDALSREVGVWNANMKMWATPEQAEPMTVQAQETNRMIGPFWLVSQFKAELGEASFAGRGQLGYDPVSKKYVGTWVDTMTPYMATLEGTRDPESDTLTMTSTARDPQTGEITKTTNITKFVNENTKTFTMYRGEPGSEDAWKMMEIEYKKTAEDQSAAPGDQSGS